MTLSYFSQITFFSAFIVLHLKRVEQNQNCITFCIKHSSNNDSSANFSAKKQPINDNKIEASSGNRTTNRIKRFFKKINLFDLLFKSKLNYVLIVFFGIYFVCNLYVVSYRLRIDLPIEDLIPNESYLKKHSVNHNELYNLGPIIILAFMKPINYWNKTEFNRIRLFLNEAKTVKNIDPMFEMNWLQDTYLNSIQKGAFEPKCFKRPLKFECFYDAMKETVAGFDMYMDDVIYDDYYVKQDNVNTSEQHVFHLNSSRIYLGMSKFMGQIDELETIENLKWLARQKYNFSEEELVIHSVVFPFMEQLSEIGQSILSIIVLNLDVMIFVAYFILFDLRSILILGVVLISCYLSIVSNLILFGFSLNFPILTHFIMLPAFFGEFFYTTGYLYLYYRSINGTKEQKKIQMKFKKSTDVEDKNNDGGENNEDKCSQVLIEETNSCSSSSSSSTNDEKIAHVCDNSLKTRITNNRKIRLNKLKNAYFKCFKHVAYYLIFIVILNLLIMHNCTTYNFKAFYYSLLSAFLNIFAHVYLFYPILLSNFGQI
jgi:hypothetical protein